MNTKKSNPSLKDLLDLLKRDVFLSMNCHAIGTIEGFDSSVQTVSVTINYTKTKDVADEEGNFSEKATSYPLLLDIPVVIMQGGKSSLTFPIKKGDQCLVLFNDRDIDNWFVDGSKTSSPNSQRAHSMSDGIALIGLRTADDALDNYDEFRASLGDGTVKVAVGKFGGVGLSLVEISNQTTSLGVIMSTMLTAMAAATTVAQIAAAAAAAEAQIVGLLR